MNYPLISEYIESIKSAEDNFNQLSSLRPVLDDDGNPIMSSGNFAVVFKMTDGDKDYAVKCFTKEQEGRDEAYRMIAEELEFVQSSYLVSIKYLPDELFVDSSQTDTETFPVVVMDWVEGDNLDTYIRQHVNDEYAMSLLAYQFCRMAMWLLSQPFAHGDLKPDNILVRNDGTLVLVDYDGMFVPAMRGMKSRELGSPDYTHPLRTADDFNEHTDDFSIAVIALSLKAIALNPTLLNNTSDGALLFHADDYRDLSKCEAISSISSLLYNIEIERLYSLFLLAHSLKELPSSSFRLFALERPEKPVYENLSTEVTDEDFSNGVEDEYGVIYSKDGKRLLGATRNLEKYCIKAGTIVICDGAFWGCESLQAIHIPNSVTNIGNRAFECTSLKEIHIPNSVASIGSRAFYLCTSLKEIHIPNSVTSIGENPFEYCKISLNSDSKDYIVIDNNLYSKGIAELISYCSNNDYFEVPNGVKRIGNRAFQCCKSLKEIHIPNSVTSIGNEAFYECESLKEIHIPNSVTNIGNMAFAWCTSLQTIYIPYGTKDKFERLLPEHLHSILCEENVNK